MTREEKVERTYMALCIIAFMLHVAAWWLGTSGLCSGIKTITHDCQSRYPIEDLVQCDWLCPEKD